TTASATAVADTITAIKFGTYQLGANDTTRPTGYRNIATVVVKDTVGGTTTYVAGVDYVIDSIRGTITFIEGGTITEGNPAYITYNVGVSTRTQVVSSNDVIEGALWFKAFNPKGPKIDYFMPYVSLAPDGDFALKGDDWLKITYSLDVQRKGGLARVYADGQAVAA
ncbi:hypothetical protein AEAC466_04255, partial [Asticcacaulis sp. AC466]|uniref:phage tail tube protein n=1 Tax=Asticcacaulis sp. AC466 TaxID=1282362 RepID=UPI0003C3E983